jgi:hypothetical protein
MRLGDLDRLEISALDEDARRRAELRICRINGEPGDEGLCLVLLFRRLTGMKAMAVGKHHGGTCNTGGQPFGHFSTIFFSALHLISCLLCSAFFKSSEAPLPNKRSRTQSLGSTAARVQPRPWMSGSPRLGKRLSSYYVRASLPHGTAAKTKMVV